MTEMTRRLLLAGTAAAAPFAGWVRVVDAAVPKDTAVFAKQIDDLISLDPGESYEISGGEIATNVYDRLLRFEAEDMSKLVGGAAESWTVSPDGKAFTFKIRPNLKFHSGAPVTAEAARLEASLEVSGLTKRFGGLLAVKDMALNVQAGKILGLIGPNGSGKSTVMKLIMGIERPNAGSVRINGVEVAGWPSHKIARMGAGIVFQHSRPLHRQTVLENIKLALLPDKLTRLFADPHVDEHARAIAARVGLSHVRQPSSLVVTAPPGMPCSS